MKHLSKLILLVAACLTSPVMAATVTQRQVQPVNVEVARQKAWPKEAVQAFGSLPIQDRGRVKPLSTYAGFRMLNTNGKRSYTVPAGFGLPTSTDKKQEKLGPVEWLLDVMLFPEQARNYEVFLVNDNAVLEEIGLRFEGRKRRDRYSFNQLMPGLAKLEAANQRVRAKAAANTKLEPVEKQISALYSAAAGYNLLESSLQSLVANLGPAPSERLLELFPEAAGDGALPLGTVLRRWSTVTDWMRDATPEESEDVMAEFGPLQDSIRVAFENAPFALALFPPVDGEIETWRTAGNLVNDTMGMAAPVDDSEFELLNAFASIWTARGSVDTASAAIQKAHGLARSAAEARGEYANIPLERTYYRGDFFTRALVFFLLGFVLAAISWMVPWSSKASTWLVRGVWTMTLIGLALCVTGVTIRCILLQRPPVATLYETILFITAGAVAVCLVAEKLTKERIGLAVAPVLGAGGMFLSMRNEIVEAASQGDTMGGLMAVLNTNFWLATHVTSVTLGYAAGLLAAALAHVWIVMRLFRAFKDRGARLDADSAGFYRRFAGIVYGVLCFGLLLSVVGTILGGVWANDSWGRFWGWDPKENGALMIVLFELVILHARMAGFIKDFGVCLMSVMGGAVVAFSWWHVNQLGVGLHSYGFLDGVLKALWSYYGFVAVFTILSAIGWMMFLRPRPTLDPA